MNRRRYLRLAGASAVAAAVAGCNRPDETETPTRSGTPTDTATPSTESPSPTPTDTESPSPTPFGEVVDVVKDLGCDPSGEKPCNDALERGAAPGRMLRFPEGRYRLDDFLTVSVDGPLAMAGEDGAWLVPPRGYSGKLTNVEATELHFRNLGVDVTAPETAAGLKFVADDNLLVESVTFEGRGTSPDTPVGFAVLPAVRDRDGSGVVRDLVATKGSAIGHYKDGAGRGGVWVGGLHRGALRIEGCRLEEFGNNGIYASRTPGTVEVVDCVLRNNSPAGIRISGEGSVVRDTTVEVDMDEYTGPRSSLQSSFRPRGIVVEQGGPFDIPPGVRVENCDVRIRKTPAPAQGIHVWSTGHTVTVVDSTIRMDVAAPGVDRVAAEASHGAEPSEPPRGIHLENTTVVATDPDTPAVRVYDGAESTIRNSTVRHRAGRGDAVQFVDSPGAVVEGSTIEAGQYPLVGNVGDGASDCQVSFVGTPTLRSSSVDPSGGRVRSSPVDSPGSACFSPDLPDSLPRDGNDFAVVGVDEEAILWVTLPGDDG